MLFNSFKRRKEEPPRIRPATRAASAPRAAAPVARSPVRAEPEPVALPEVVAEGNTQADWGAWEDSMISWDSQLQDLPPSDRIYVRDSAPSQLDAVDAFASVGKKRDL